MIALIIVSSYCFGEENISIMFYSNEQRNFYCNYFSYKKIQYIEDENYIKLLISTEILKHIIAIEYLKIEISKDNISNINTTRTITGGPYKRKYLDITDEIVIKEDDAEGRLVYDPFHPDAIKDGQRKDYVSYPNVNLEDEYQILIEAVQLYNSIVEYIYINNIEMIIEKIQVNTIDEIRHYNKIEKQLEIYFKILLDEMWNIQNKMIMDNYSDKDYNDFLEKMKNNGDTFNNFNNNGVK
jgi:flagellar basal body rod protein FlgC